MAKQARKKPAKSTKRQKREAAVSMNVRRERFQCPPEVISVPNPANSPWPDGQQLTVSMDTDAPLGPNDWVAAFDGRRCYIGKVENLQRSFRITDLTTGRRVNLGRKHQPYYGKVVGRFRGLDKVKRVVGPKGE